MERGGRVARESLVYTDNGLLDPWLVAQFVIQSTSALSPLVAVQPVYMHPYSVAKMVATLSLLYERRIDLNIVAGGFRNDLIALGDQTPHDRRYARLIEYTTIIRGSAAGRVGHAQGRVLLGSQPQALAPELDPALMPRILLSGSSAEGLARGGSPGRAARCAIRSRRPNARAAGSRRSVPEFGIRVGIIGREGRSRRRGQLHRQRFPEDRRGQAIHQLAMKVSDSAWHRQLSAIAPRAWPRERVLDGSLPELQDLLPLPGGQLRARWARRSAVTWLSGCRRSSSTCQRREDELEHVKLALAAGEKAGLSR